MPLIARELDVSPRPLALAMAAGDAPGFAFLWSADGSAASYIATDPVDAREGIDPEPGLPFEPRGTGLSGAPRWIGVLPYEGFRSLERPRYRPVEVRPPPHVPRPLWYRYGAVAVVTDRVLVVGDDAARVRRLSDLLRGTGEPSPIAVRGDPAVESDGAHRDRIRKALKLIRQGHVYQVNLARRLSFGVSGRAVDLVAALNRGARAPYAAALTVDGTDVIGSSPELLLAVEPDGRFWTAPIKGTRPRGGDSEAERRMMRELDEDPKERAELWMVVDVERNDLGRVAVAGSVRVGVEPRVRAFGPVHHRFAVVSARFAPGTPREALLRAVLPSGSVTGAPKVRAMEVIADLEAERRGLYTGAIGFVRHDGGVRLSMAIRTLTVKDGVGHYFVGGGIVAESDPEREVLETRWKAQQVFQLFEGFQGVPDRTHPEPGGRQNLAAPEPQGYRGG